MANTKINLILFVIKLRQKINFKKTNQSVESIRIQNLMPPLIQEFSPLMNDYNYFKEYIIFLSDKNMTFLKIVPTVRDFHSTLEKKLLKGTIKAFICAEASTILCNDRALASE